MRGEDIIGVGCCCAGGITPAHAGRSVSLPGLSRSTWDHPRACGEKYIVQLYFDTDMGSPPRMRGEAGLAARHRAKSRITPAHAGRSFKQFIQSLFFQDHPRACGEKLALSAISVMAIGSPPRMRGEASTLARIPAPVRITPAHAGRRQSGHSPGGASRDHPRACGEKAIDGNSSPRSQGSPPRMRGEGTYNHTRR